MNKKRKIIFMVIGIVLTIGIVMGVSYSWWMFTATQESVNTITSDCINLELLDIEDSHISLENAYPLTDDEANALIPYTFKVTNTCNIGIEYNINLEIIETPNLLASEFIAISLDNAPKKLLNTLEEATITLNNAVEGRKLGTGTLAVGRSRTHSLKLWMDEHVTAQDDVINKTFKSKITIEATSKIVAYTEEILNGADPVLAENLIPVEIDDSGKVTKANLNDEWYSYAEKKWANAVILDQEYMQTNNKKEFTDGQEIPESAIESYFVWIPKYSYKIQTLEVSSSGQEQAFEIRFGTENTSDEKEGECTTPSREVASGENYYSGNCQVGDFMTHPAFIHFKDGIKGLWVGKFETGYKGATSTSGAQKGTADASKVIVKPNVYSWRSISMSNMHNTAIAYKPEYESHVMKNTEWGAVAYLTNSNYGRCTNGTCTEVYINNNSNYITGWSGITVSASSSATGGYVYTNSNSTNASTTGNYTGIYDMSGGADEYVMGNIADTKSSSGFSSMPVAKYYDKYASNSNINIYTGRILGDATAETKNWFSNSAGFAYSTNPWFLRGGHLSDGTSAGVFYSATHGAPGGTAAGSRIVLAV